jgi:DnaJ-class molecular chaperone
MCNICGGKGYLEMKYYEKCKYCSVTPEQIKNRMWNTCKECNRSGYYGRGTVMKVIKNICPYCHFNKLKLDNKSF